MVENTVIVWNIITTIMYTILFGLALIHIGKLNRRIKLFLVLVLIGGIVLGTLIGYDMGKSNYNGFPIDFKDLRVGEQLFLRMPSNLVAVKSGNEIRIVKNPPVNLKDRIIGPLVIREAADGKRLVFLPEKKLE